MKTGQIALIGHADWLRQCHAFFRHFGFDIPLCVAQTWEGALALAPEFGAPVLAFDDVSDEKLADLDCPIFLASPDLEFHRTVMTRHIGLGIPRPRTIRHPALASPRMAGIINSLSFNNQSTPNEYVQCLLDRYPESGQNPIRALAGYLSEKIRRDLDPARKTIAVWHQNAVYRGNVGSQEMYDRVRQKGYNVITLFGIICGDKFEKCDYGYYAGSGIAKYLDFIDLAISVIRTDKLPERTKLVHFNHDIYHNPHNNRTPSDDQGRASAQPGRELDYQVLPCKSFINHGQMMIDPNQKTRPHCKIPGGYSKLDNNIRYFEQCDLPVDSIVYAPTILDYMGKRLHYLSLPEYGEQIVRALLDHFPNYKIIFRPHPGILPGDKARVADAFADHELRAPAAHVPQLLFDPLRHPIAKPELLGRRRPRPQHQRAQHCRQHTTFHLTGPPTTEPHSGACSRQAPLVILCRVAPHCKNPFAFSNVTLQMAAVGSPRVKGESAEKALDATCGASIIAVKRRLAALTEGKWEFRLKASGEGWRMKSYCTRGVTLGAGFHYMGSTGWLILCAVFCASDLQPSAEAEDWPNTHPLPVQPVDREALEVSFLRDQVGLSDKVADEEGPVTVGAVAPGSPAEQAGLRKGDTIISFWNNAGDYDVSSVSYLARNIDGWRADGHATQKIAVRRGQEVRLLELPCGTLKGIEYFPGWLDEVVHANSRNDWYHCLAATRLARSMIGISTPDRSEKNEFVRGPLVLGKVYDDGPGAAAKLQPGDRLVRYSSLFSRGEGMISVSSTALLQRGYIGVGEPLMRLLQMLHREPHATDVADHLRFELKVQRGKQNIKVPFSIADRMPGRVTWSRRTASLVGDIEQEWTPAPGNVPELELFGLMNKYKELRKPTLVPDKTDDAQAAAIQLRDGPKRIRWSAGHPAAWLCAFDGSWLVE